jgi:ribosome-binding factor A
VVLKDYSRQDRLASQISRELANLLIDNPQMPPNIIITITGVELSKDLRSGKVYYSVYGDETSTSRAEEFFNDNQKIIRKELAGKIRVRFIPELAFVYDRSIERGQRISELLEKIKKDDNKK